MQEIQNSLHPRDSDIMNGLVRSCDSDRAAGVGVNMICTYLDIYAIGIDF